MCALGLGQGDSRVFATVSMFAAPYQRREARSQWPWRWNRKESMTIFEQNEAPAGPAKEPLGLTCSRRIAASASQLLRPISSPRPSSPPSRGMSGDPKGRLSGEIEV